MMVRRLASALKKQDWVTVFVEFLLVLFGVLVALQLNNWNEAKLNRNGARNALDRLRSEVLVNIAAIDGRLKILEDSKVMRRKGLDGLISCDSSPQAQVSLGDAVAQFTGDIIPSLSDNTMRELSGQDRFLDLMSNDFRIALNTYSGQMIDERDQLKINYGLMWDEHVMNNPKVSINISDADIQNVTFVFATQMDDLCADIIFRRQFIMTEGWHQSTELRLKRFKEWSEDFLKLTDAEIVLLQ